MSLMGNKKLLNFKSEKGRFYELHMQKAFLELSAWSNKPKKNKKEKRKQLHVNFMDCELQNGNRNCKESKDATDSKKKKKEKKHLPSSSLCIRFPESKSL